MIKKNLPRKWPKHDSLKVDYNSKAFKDGFKAGKTGKPPNVPETLSDDDFHSWLEGWMMGESEFSSDDD